MNLTLQCVPLSLIKVGVLRSHIRVVEGLLVLFLRGLPVVGCHLMATVIAQTTGRVCSAEVRLPALVNGRIVGPGIVPSDIVILEVAAVGSGIGHPEGGLIGLVVEEAVVPDYRAVIRIGVNYYLLVGVRCVVAAGLSTAVGFSKTVVAVASCVLCVAYAHFRGLRGWHFVVG